MGWIFMFMAVVFFFLAAVGSAVIPQPTSWGLVCMAIGLAVGGYFPWGYRRPTP
jgi:hypothetical protein